MNVEGEAPTSTDWLRGKKVPAAAAGRSPCCLESLFSQAQCQPPPSELLSPGEGAEPKKSLPSQLLASAPTFPASPVLSGPLAMTRKESREQVIEKGCPKASPQPQTIHQDWPPCICWASAIDTRCSGPAGEGPASTHIAMPGREWGRQKVPFYQLRDREWCARRSSPISNPRGQRRSRRELRPVATPRASAQGKSNAQRRSWQGTLGTE